MPSRQLIALCLLGAGLAEPADVIVGGFQDEDCLAKQDGLGFPVNSFNHVQNFVSKIFANGGQSLKLLHFSSQVVAGTIYNAVFHLPGEYEKFIGIQVFVPLPVYNEEPSIEKIIVTGDKQEALRVSGLSARSLNAPAKCSGDFAQQFAGFDVKKEVENVAKVFESQASAPANKTEWVGPLTTKNQASSATNITSYDPHDGVADKLSSILDQVGKIIEQNLSRVRRAQNATVITTQTITRTPSGSSLTQTQSTITPTESKTVRIQLPSSAPPTQSFYVGSPEADAEAVEEPEASEQDVRLPEFEEAEHEEAEHEDIGSAGFPQPPFIDMSQGDLQSQILSTLLAHAQSMSRPRRFSNNIRVIPMNLGAFP